jgi:Rhodopirellula transposase DDE domain
VAGPSVGRLLKQQRYTLQRTLKTQEGAQHPDRDQQFRYVNEQAKARVHDFPAPTLGKAIPYGVDDLGANTGWVSVGYDHDTAAFAAKAGLQVTVCHFPPGTPRGTRSSTGCLATSG